MTENKRFTLCEGTITGLKSYYECDGKHLTHLQVLDLLNDLNDENRKLKQLFIDYAEVDEDELEEELDKLKEMEK